MRSAAAGGALLRSAGTLFRWRSLPALCCCRRSFPALCWQPFPVAEPYCALLLPAELSCALLAPSSGGGAFLRSAAAGGAFLTLCRTLCRRSLLRSAAAGGVFIALCWHPVAEPSCALLLPAVAAEPSLRSAAAGGAFFSNSSLCCHSPAAEPSAPFSGL